VAPEADDVGGAGEGAEADCEAAVVGLVEVGYCFAAGAGGVEVWVDGLLVRDVISARDPRRKWAHDGRERDI